MPRREFTERILKFIGREDYQPQKLDELARSIGVAEDEYGAFHDAIRVLTKIGRVALGHSRVLLLPEPSNQVLGTFRLNPRGFGFVIPESATDHGDLFVPPGESGGAVTGDMVVARVLKRGKRNGRMMHEGKITKVLARGQSRFVGELRKAYGRWFVRPDGKIIHGPVFVDDPSAKSAREGDQVVIEVTRYPEPGKEARGVIRRVLGERGLPEVDTLSMIIQYQLPEEFPDDVLNEAHRVAAEFDPENIPADRDDLTNLDILTIDPDDARDFDDAISLVELKGGHVELGVHIADVSHFVKPDSALDVEARERSNSVYFPRFVLPMLPESLSNGVCSLQERQPRLTKSAFITYDRNGRVVKTRFANTVIRSMKRLTYRQATAIIEGKGPRVSRKVIEQVKKMERLARSIRERRLKNGMLVLDIPGVELVFDKDDNVVDVEPEDTSFSHTIIEMFMVEANEAVGSLLADLNVPNLRRIHPDPDEAASESLTRFLAAVGIKPPKVMDRAAMQAILQKVKDRPEAFAVNLALLRSLQQAEYSPKLIGHFALASLHYVHFTSPIRRYPDLTIHRLLDAYLSGQLRNKSDLANFPDTAEVASLGEQCSRNERRAEAAERELKEVKILRLLEDRVGESLDGVVTGVTGFGLYVQLSRYLVDGLLRFEELADDWWEVDTDAGCVIAQRSGQRIRLGQKLNVAILSVDLPARQLNLALGEKSQPARGTGGRKARTSRKKSSKSRAPKTQGTSPKTNKRSRKRRR